MPDPATVEEWLQLVVRAERTARTMADDKNAAADGHFHAGIAVEFALKAYIMRRERFNAWPSKEARPDLYTHNLRDLVAIAGIALTPTMPSASSWYVALQWNRLQGYDPAPMPRKVARSMVDAVFGSSGVVTWIRSSLI
jgi:hypothetical protein